MKKTNTGRLGRLFWKVGKGSLRKGMAGFTLIEVLVVVLIIGILASVAMPQYNKAVEKSRATQALAILKSLYAAQETYYMANGSYATSFDELDLSVPWTGTTKWFTLGHDTRANENWSLQIYNDGMGNCAIYLGRISGEYKGAGFTIGLSGNNGQDNGEFCFVESGRVSVFRMKKKQAVIAYKFLAVQKCLKTPACAATVCRKFS